MAGLPQRSRLPVPPEGSELQRRSPRDLSADWASPRRSIFSLEQEPKPARLPPLELRRPSTFEEPPSEGLQAPAPPQPQPQPNAQTGARTSVFARAILGARNTHRRTPERRWSRVVNQAMTAEGIPRGAFRASNNVVALMHRDEDDLKGNDLACTGTDSKRENDSDGTGSESGSEANTPRLTPKSAAAAERTALLSLLGVTDDAINARVDAERSQRRRIATNSVSVASGTLSNIHTDSFASAKFSNSKLFATAIVYAFYRD